MSGTQQGAAGAGQADKVAGRWGDRPLVAFLHLSEVATDEGLVRRFPLTARLLEELTDLMQETVEEADFAMCGETPQITDADLAEGLLAIVTSMAEYPEATEQASLAFLSETDDEPLLAVEPTVEPDPEQ